MTHGNTTQMVTKPCSGAGSARPAIDCDLTRLATLLLAFHSDVWIFPAVYYWLTWVFLVTAFFGEYLFFLRNYILTCTIFCIKYGTNSLSGTSVKWLGRPSSKASPGIFKFNIFLVELYVVEYVHLN